MPAEVAQTTRPRRRKVAGVSFRRLHHFIISAMVRTTPQQGLVADYTGIPANGDPQAPLIVSGIGRGVGARNVRVPRADVRAAAGPFPQHDRCDIHPHSGVNIRYYRPPSCRAGDRDQRRRDDHLPGIADIVARARGGVGVVLELVCVSHVSYRPVLSSGLGGLCLNSTEYRSDRKYSCPIEPGAVQELHIRILKLDAKR
ncbi:hypothetical protein EDB87DRAFT_1661104 [Lactarius vividus]|nr:hypothetical protein EDB87DRAFT_1661104 [Lactarius vividus]